MKLTHQQGKHGHFCGVSLHMMAHVVEMFYIFRYHVGVIRHDIMLLPQHRNSHGTVTTSCRLAGVQNRIFCVADTSTERNPSRAVMGWGKNSTME
jgi:hypothetical protein